MALIGDLENRIKIAVIFIMIFFSIVLFRLFQLCVIEGQRYRILSENNRQRIIPLTPQRGIIYDRNGNQLVKNLPYFVVTLNAEEIEEGRLLLIAKFLDIEVDEVKKRILQRVSQFEPVILKEGLTFNEVAFIEARLSDFPELSVSTTFIRNYVYGEVASHMLGYLGRITKKQWKEMREQGIPQDAMIGQWGVEALYDSSLRGVFGKKIIEVDALQREIRVLKEIPPQKGSDIRLSIDINLQKRIEESYDGRGGAFIAVNPLSGEVLALGSLPSFDPNKFSKGIDLDYWNDLNSDPEKPLLNRVFQSQYPPGSVFKIITAIAALEDGVIKPSFRVNCGGSYAVESKVFRCWKKEGHGTVDLRKAIIESCDVYFYELGRRVGIDRIAEYARRLGLDSYTGVKLVSEKKGIIPDTSWKMRVRKEPWYLGETAIASIGQGYVSVTPAQLVRMISAIANGGELLPLQILKNEGFGGNGPDNNFTNNTGISKETIDFIRDALRGVIEDDRGTGVRARINGVSVAGKTGTAQVVSKIIDSERLPKRLRDHAWFVSFAPVENPEIAIAVLVEHGGHGGSAAAPIARNALESFLLKDSDHSKRNVDTEGYNTETSD